ncbi:DUF6677 family protein [Cohnella yongneupensis]|uniref:DUF6677 family protein n=1 Tax=Cohnella yongneupensis TaxID=425006 RepID=A0ABW0R1E6_9BACL
MNAPDQWNHNNHRMPPGYPPPYGRSARRRSKWIAGLLAFLVPGTGHMYVGKMVKAVVIMLLIAGNITAIVQVATANESSVLAIVLLSLFLPIIYFYNLFDAIESAEIVNERIAATEWNANPGNPNPQPIASHTVRGVPLKKFVLFAVAGLVLCMLAQQTWAEWQFDSTFSMIGAVLLIGGGIALWIWELRGPQGPKP